MYKFFEEYVIRNIKIFNREYWSSYIVDLNYETKGIVATNIKNEGGGWL